MWGRLWQSCWVKRYLSVHPHACGADGASRRDHLGVNRFIPTHVGQTPISGNVIIPITGSSPRMWGRRRCSCTDFRRRPVHPHACGADAERTDRSRSTITVHPHACGADVMPMEFYIYDGTVHPHACGADCFFVSNRVHDVRFIPTHVGQTLSLDPYRRPASVHPHACGADVHFFAVDVDCDRFIPTHVGQTSSVTV